MKTFHKHGAAVAQRDWQLLHVAKKRKNPVEKFLNDPKTGDIEIRTAAARQVSMGCNQAMPVAATTMRINSRRVWPVGNPAPRA